jgi:hypothetical protein
VREGFDMASMQFAFCNQSTRGGALVEVNYPQEVEMIVMRAVTDGGVVR